MLTRVINFLIFIQEKRHQLYYIVEYKRRFLLNDFELKNQIDSWEIFLNVNFFYMSVSDALRKRLVILDHIL